MRNFVILTLMALHSSLVFSTTFVPLSIKKQIKHSDGVLQGEVISISSENDGEKIITKVTVLANKWIGLNPEENFLEIYYPGGEIGDRANKVSGSPKFEIGENIIVFTKEQNGRNWINNLGLGKFSMKRVGDQNIMINQIFPGMPQVGQMTVNKFYDLSEWVKKEKFQNRYKDKYEINSERQVRVNSRKPGRKIASISNDELAKNKIPAYWLVLIFGFLGVGFSVIRNRKS